ncbi:Tetratricopeptide repeat protein [Candidatus Sulfotelmatomonas gaucii]|uniref:Tetratricopeptide repeat protein n=1 Tax=Candidatus Sulfuritelmatomonas gaucii TaxID=2043161 RepID=A0A2N9L2B6_9BACT|nr:Tetratricopeptide repeat protein [Candidatus Sulfotelmatomonas gaucii]
MKNLAVFAMLFALSGAWAQDSTLKPVVLMPGLGNLHHPVSTTNSEAQQFFDQGLRLVYAFNHEEAARSFRHAAELDPKLAMAWWGVTLAVGPNYNLPVDPEREKIAESAIEKAKSLYADAPQIEKDYVDAMARRFSGDANPDYHQLDLDYSRAMRELSQKYPDDLDAATLFADSMMNLRPWRLWNADGTPAEGTNEIVSTLEGVLRRDPHHMGAMHLYIHAVEASPHPERALPFAEEIATLAPAAGHLVHMPAHIYERTGNFDGARAQNAAAAKADEDYAAATGSQGLYMMMYYSHNLHFGAVSASMQGRCAEAKQFADRLAGNLRPALKDMPMVEPFVAMPFAIAVRCRQWDDVMAASEPAAQTPTLKAFWLYSRGIALAVQSKTAEAAALEQQLAAIEKATSHDDLYMPPVENHTWQIYHIADDVLAARIATAKGDKPGAIELLRDAVATQDKLLYDEPSDWYYPVRESLGGMLLQAGDVKGAEQVFRDDLEKNPRNPRSLFGLADALTRQHRDYEASWVKQQLQTAWQGADVELKVEDL